MKKQSKNFIFIKYLNTKKIKIDKNEFNFQLETHPDYPSLLSFYDALHFFNINSFATKITDKSTIHLPKKFIAEIKYKNTLQLYFVQKNNTEYTIFSDENTNEIFSENDFKDVWSGIVLIIKSNNIGLSKNNKSFKNKALKNIILMSFILFATYYSLWLGISILLIFTGIFLSIEAIKQGYHIETNFSSKFCNASAELDCNTIINSDKFKIFKIFGFSDLSIVFFIAQFIGVLFFISTNAIIDFTKLSLYTLLASIPITLVSIYYQWRVVKKWCVVCLGIIIVLYVELIINSLYYYTIPNITNINTMSFLYIAISFIIPLISWLLIKPIITKYYALQSENKKLIKFKRSYSLFKHSLLAERKIDYKNLESVISIGNKNSKLKITIVTNPMCDFCKKAHLIIEELLHKYSESIQFNIHFSFLPSKEKNNPKDALHYKFIDIYLKQGEVKFMEALGDWFKNKDLEKWFFKYGRTIKNESEIKNLLKKQHTNNRNNSILFTPTIFIGEYNFPQIYEREDVLLYIEELLEDKEILI